MRYQIGQRMTEATGTWSGLIDSILDEDGDPVVDDITEPQAVVVRIDFGANAGRYLTLDMRQWERTWRWERCH